IVKVQEDREERRIRRQHHGRALARESTRGLHGAKKRVELGLAAHRICIDARRLAISLAPALLCELDRFPEDERLLLLCGGSHLEPLLLPLRAIEHADATAFGFHPGVEAKAVLLWKIEAAQLYVDDFDTVVVQCHRVAAASDFAGNGMRPVNCGI